MRRNSFGLVQIATVLVLIAAFAYLGWLGYGMLPEPVPTSLPAVLFSGPDALALAQEQCDIGPRPTGSPAGWQTGSWIIDKLEEAGWEVETHEFAWGSLPVRNIIAKAGVGTPIMVGAHYDTRLIADRDPDPSLTSSPIIGANDGASGVAVLLELANTLDKETLKNEVWLTFFDAEDNGRIEGWQWAIGSTALAQDLERLPAAMILLDMVGDANQQFLFEANSNPILSEQLWTLAAELGYDQVFIKQPGQAMIDDHIAFIQQGVPAVDIIHTDYPYWHTTLDTCDKLSADSLARVGRLVEVYLERGLLADVLPQLQVTPAP